MGGPTKCFSEVPSKALVTPPTGAAAGGGVEKGGRDAFLRKNEWDDTHSRTTSGSNESNAKRRPSKERLDTIYRRGLKTVGLQRGDSSGLVKGKGTGNAPRKAGKTRKTGPNRD